MLVFALVTFFGGQMHLHKWVDHCVFSSGESFQVSVHIIVLLRVSNLLYGFCTCSWVG